VGNVIWALHDLGGLGSFACGTDNFLMVFMAHEQDLITLSRVADGLGVDLGDQGAGGVDRGQAAFFGEGPYGRGDAMGGEDDDAALGDLVQVIDEDDVSLTEAPDNMLVMHDFVVAVDRFPGEELEHLIDDVHGHAHAGTEASGVGEQDLHAGRFQRKASRLCRGVGEQESAKVMSGRLPGTIRGES
jgi:hypothetical protein